MILEDSEVKKREGAACEGSPLVFGEMWCAL